MVKALGVRKSFGRQEVLKGVDLIVRPGEVVCLIGPSGSGKTTLLRTLNHLETVDSGLVHIDGALIGYRREGHLLHELSEAQICANRASIGMVFQHFNLFRHMTVMENLIEGPVGVKKQSKAQAVEKARALLKRVGLADKEKAYPAQLSGGQQQRVAIARALCMDPKLMLFDEPTSGLDPELVGEVLAVMRDLARSGMTMVVVTHEIGFARQVADHIVFMADGAIIEEGSPPELIDAPQQPRTRDFLKAVLS